MTAPTAPTTPRKGTTAGDAGRRVTFPRLVRSELIKLVSVRSTVWSLSVAVVVLVGFAALMAYGITEQVRAAGGVPGAEMGLDLSTGVGATAAVFGVFLGQLVFVVLGVLAIGSEYSTGMIRSTLTAAPTRVPALAAKTLVYGTVAFLVAAVSMVVAFVVAQPLLASEGLDSTFGDTHVARMLLGGALYLATMTVFSLAVGTVVRSTAAGISVVVALVLILPIFLPLIPWQWIKDAAAYLPNAAESVFSVPGYNSFSPWEGYAVLLVWTAVAATAAVVLLRRRDA